MHTLHMQSTHVYACMCACVCLCVREKVHEHYMFTHTNTCLGHVHTHIHKEKKYISEPSALTPGGCISICLDEKKKNVRFQPFVLGSSTVKTLIFHVFENQQPILFYSFTFFRDFLEKLRTCGGFEV